MSEDNSLDARQMMKVGEVTETLVSLTLASEPENGAMITKILGATVGALVGAGLDSMEDVDVMLREIFEDSRWAAEVNVCHHLGLPTPQSKHPNQLIRIVSASVAGKH